MADIDVDGHWFDHEPRKPVRDVWEDGEQDACFYGFHECCDVDGCVCPCHRGEPEFPDADDHGYAGDGTSDCARCYYPMNAHDPALTARGVDGVR